jgi:predicted aldo/keto reductase-like oxidoreductase
MCPHGVNTPFEIKNYPEIFEAFEVLKKSGKVRNFGISAHTDPAGNLAAAMDSGVYSAAMVAFNIVNRARVEPVLAKAKAANFGVIAMKVARPVHNNEDRSKLVNGVVAGPLKPQQKAYVWALRNPGLSGVISEMITQQHVDDNLPLAKVAA